MIEIPLGKSGQLLVIPEISLRHFRKYRQTKPWHREAGGQLFAAVSRFELYLSEVTGPRATDERTRRTYKPDRHTEQAEIIEHHRRGLQYIGDWHTHPEAAPHPSGTDYESMADCFRKSGHSLNAFLLLIVGNASLPRSLHISLHDQRGVIAELEPRNVRK